VIELIKLGHPEAERKLAGKVTAVQIRDLFIAKGLFLLPFNPCRRAC